MSLTKKRKAGKAIRRREVPGIIGHLAPRAGDRLRVHAFVCFLMQKTTRLSDWGLIHVSGPDAVNFLHGQLTNDLLHLAPGHTQWTGYCTPKGRLLAVFLAWRDEGDGVWMMTESALIPALVKRLRMFVLRAKATIEDCSTTYAGIALMDTEASGVAGAAERSAAGWRICFPALDATHRAMLWAPVEPASGAVSMEAAEVALRDEWTRLMIASGEGWVTAATQEQFVPQMINFDVQGGISFKKGCYPGQEIVARAHYRGAVKRRMYRAMVDAPAKPGDPLFSGDAAGQECGTVVLAAPSQDGATELLAVVQMQSRDEDNVHFGAADGPRLRFASLPYSIASPDDAAA